ncbi:uncharacterized protein LOC123530393 [Mercenaria mercenaria]|uniref:uncharacterized protein LOC123530393 n=1 Tax=Mercenaria mercenaria TaxID=6596 RepID=UPI00234F5041|nr:uncharacterized protein LOC123530393 [Mercenaria mercenaria]
MYKKLQALGFVINNENSVVIPCQRIVFFGYILDSVLFMVFLPEEKIQKIISKASKLLHQDSVRIRDLASFIGLLINAFHAVLEAPLHYRSLERLKVEGLSLFGDYNAVLKLTDLATNEIEWWVKNIRAKNGKKIRQDSISTWIQCDASNAGWGCFHVDSSVTVGGRWTRKEMIYHINYLELLAIFFALKSLFSKHRDIHIGIQSESDNTTAISHVNKMGGMCSPDMDNLAKQIWSWSLERNIFLSAFHLPGCNNLQADFASRNFSDTTEWKLKEDIFKRLSKHFMQPNIDLFASRLNKQLDCYVSWMPDPGAWAVNAFSLNWKGLEPYIFPPFNLLSKVLNKIMEDEVEEALLICPFWPNQTWFPLFLHRLICLPIRLPRHRDLLRMVHNRQLHPMGKQLCLIGGLVSGCCSRIEEFQKGLLTRFSRAGGLELGNSIRQRGGSGLCGVVSGAVIPFHPLKRI